MSWQIKTKDGNIYGPVDSEILSKWIREKRILDDDFAWIADRNEWVIIKSLPELKFLFKSGAAEAGKQKTAEAKIPTPKELADFLNDDKKTLTDQVIADAWRAMLAKGIWSIVGAVLLWIILIICAGISLMPVFMVFKVIPQLSPISFIIRLAVNFVWYLFVAAFNLGWAAYFLKIARRETVNVGSTFEGFKGQYIWRAFGAYLLMALLTALATIVSFGIWGVYLTLAYVFSYFFIFDENKGPWEAMKSSFDIKGYKFRIIAIHIVCMLLGILFLGIGLFVTMPLAYIATASLYYRIRTGRVSEKHLKTRSAEYLMVLIVFVVIISVIILAFAITLKEKFPLLFEHIKPMLENLPKPQIPMR